MTDHPNINQWSSLASVYDQFRPGPPPAIVPLLCQLARTDSPQLVVDLGCGTGLATRIWADHAERVIGIEPNDAMREVAATNTSANMSYQSGYGHATTLPDSSVDIVIIASALHWMEPKATVDEIHRILRSGGVFASVDFRFPPTIDWELDQAFIAVHQRSQAVTIADKLGQPQRQSGHMDLLAAKMRYTSEVMMHTTQSGTVDDLIGLARTDPDYQRARQQGSSDTELGITYLQQLAEQRWGNQLPQWYLHYRIRLAIK